MLGRAEFAAGHRDRAEEVTAEGVAIARVAGDTRAVGERLAQLAEIVYDRGDLEEARALLDEALKLAREARDGHPIADCLRILGMIERDEGGLDEAKVRLREAAAIQRSLADWMCTSMSLDVLGDVALLEDDTEGAATFLAEALELQRRLGFPHLQSDTLLGLAAVEVARGAHVRAARLFGAQESLRRETDVGVRLGSTDRRDAVVGSIRSALGEDAFETARRAGSEMTRDDALAFALGGPDRATTDATDEQPSPLAGRFRVVGDVWEASYAGTSTLLRDAKGLRYIHRLLEHAGRELHVSELLVQPPGPPNPVREDGAQVIGGTHAGEVLDARAKDEYRRRILGLREEIDEAARWADDERRARAEAELDFISRELGAALGLGGRDRRAADSSERIRKAVSNRIRESLARIARENPDLGRHLDNAISTGTFCSYRPERPVEWEL